MPTHGMFPFLLLSGQPALPPPFDLSATATAFVISTLDASFKVRYASLTLLLRNSPAKCKCSTRDGRQATSSDKQCQAWERQAKHIASSKRQRLLRAMTPIHMSIHLSHPLSCRLFSTLAAFPCPEMLGRARTLILTKRPSGFQGLPMSMSFSSSPNRRHGTLALRGVLREHHQPSAQWASGLDKGPESDISDHNLEISHQPITPRDATKDKREEALLMSSNHLDRHPVPSHHPMHGREFDSPGCRPCLALPCLTLPYLTLPTGML